MTAPPSVAVLRPSTSVRSDIRLAEWNPHSSPTPLAGRPVRLHNSKAVSVEPSALQPSPPMPSIRLRTCETCGFLPRRLLRSAILTPCGQGLRSFRLHYAHSALKSPRLTGGPQNDSGVRYRSRAVREFTRLPGPYSQAYIPTQSHPYFKTLIKNHFIKPISSKTASPSA